jgi:hypothetical protein
MYIFTKEQILPYEQTSKEIFKKIKKKDSVLDKINLKPNEEFNLSVLMNTGTYPIILNIFLHKENKNDELKTRWAIINEVHGNHFNNQKFLEGNWKAYVEDVWQIDINTPDSWKNFIKDMVGKKWK